MELQITEGLRMGLKVNKSTVEEKKMTIQEILKLMNITRDYAVGLDEKVSKKQIPHYHIHFTYYGTHSALTKYKQRKMPKWGASTKLYKAKAKHGSDLYAWYGYACKETIIEVSPEIEMEKLKQNAHTQKAFWESKQKYGEKIEMKKLHAVSNEEKLFQFLDLQHSGKVLLTVLDSTNGLPLCCQGKSELSKVLASILKWHMETFNKLTTFQRCEHLSYKWLLTRNKMTYEEFIDRKKGNFFQEFYF
jgi:hypothetical protein